MSKVLPHYLLAFNEQIRGDQLRMEEALTHAKSRKDPHEDPISPWIKEVEDLVLKGRGLKVEGDDPTKDHLKKCYRIVENQLNALRYIQRKVGGHQGRVAEHNIKMFERIHLLLNSIQTFVPLGVVEAPLVRSPKPKIEPVVVSVPWEVDYGDTEE